MKIQIGHISDMHFCMENLEEANRCVGFAVDKIIERGCDAAVISGDSTDHRLDLHSPATAALISHVYRLAENMPTLLLHGTASHEPPGTLEVFKTIGGKYPVYVADRIKQVALVGNTWVESSEWCFSEIPADTRALFSVLPSVNKGAVAAIHGAEKAAEMMGEYVFQLLKGWSPINLRARQQETPTIAVSHGTVTGCVNETGVPMMGLDFEFSTGSLFAAECSAFLLGHVHKMQIYEYKGRRAGYAGSPGRYHYGELDPKGCLIWDVQPDSATCDFIETPAKRLVQIEFPGAPDMDELKTLAAAASDAHVRIRYVLDEEHRHGVDKAAITALFAAAAEVKIEARINPIQRTRAEGMYRAQTLADKLAKWCEVTQTDPAPLTERLAVISHKDPEAIVTDILGETRREAAA